MKNLKRKFVLLGVGMLAAIGLTVGAAAPAMAYDTYYYSQGCNGISSSAKTTVTTNVYGTIFVHVYDAYGNYVKTAGGGGLRSVTVYGPVVASFRAIAQSPGQYFTHVYKYC